MYIKKVYIREKVDVEQTEETVLSKTTFLRLLKRGDYFERIGRLFTAQSLIYVEGMSFPNSRAM